MEKLKFGGWENCYRLDNSRIELIVTGDVGPRVIRFGFIGRENMFKEYEDQLGVTEAQEWLIFGGHRLWHAPEAQPRTYYPDSEPVLVQEIENGLIVTQQPEPTTGLQKQIEITLSPDNDEVHLTHFLINHNLWAIETAAWAPTVMSPGGVALLPLPPRGTHPECLLPTNLLSLWPYTNLSDPRWILGEKVIMLRQDPTNKTPQKIGSFVPDGWGAYVNHGALFIKRIPIQFEGLYPDLGVNFEVFTNNDMLELESLGPIETVPPKGRLDHHEHWTLLDGFSIPKSESEVLTNIIPEIVQ